MYLFVHTQTHTHMCVYWEIYLGVYVLCTYYFLKNVYKFFVLYFLGINETAEVILKRPQKNDIKPGSDVILRCQITGNPPPSILWYRNKFR